MWKFALSLTLGLALNAQAQKAIEFDIATAAPRNVPLIGNAPHEFADVIKTISGSSLQATVHDPDFNRASQSLNQFRNRFATWRDLGHVIE